MSRSFFQWLLNLGSRRRKTHFNQRNYGNVFNVYSCDEGGKIHPTAMLEASFSAI
jgi:hypothetical protein